MALGVIADGADEPDVGAEAGSGDRLIRAFAARAAVEDAVGDRFAGPGERWTRAVRSTLIAPTTVS